MGRPATLRVDILADAKKVGPGVAEAESKLSKLGKAGKVVGAAAAAGLAAAGAAAVAFGVKAVGAASRVQQSYGALETIYGKHAGQVKRWAKNAADSVGLAASEYAELSGLVGAQLQNMGIEQDKSARRSDKLIRLGADLAATYGGTVSDAVAAVSSLMKGEADPIERYGVSIKAADVSARLAAQGLDDLTGKAAKQAQANALLSLLNEQTAKTTGAFAKESNTLAGKQERLRAKVENLSGKLGEKLLPAATKVTGWLGEKFLPAAERLAGQLGNRFGPVVNQVGGFITGRLVPAIRRLVDWVQTKLVPGIQRYATPIVEGLQRAFGKVSAAVERNRPALQKLLGAVRSVVEFMASKVLPIVGKVAGKGFEVLGTVIGGVVDVIGNLIEFIDRAIGKISDLVDWVKRIDIPKIDIPFIGGAVGNLTTTGVALTGQAPSYDNRLGWSTASSAGSSWSTVAAAPQVGNQVMIVDRRDLSTTIQLPADPLGLVDEAATARRLQQLLDRHRVRVGQATAPAGARL